MYLCITYLGINNINKNPAMAGIIKSNCFVKAVIAITPNWFTLILNKATIPINVKIMGKSITDKGRFCKELYTVFNIIQYHAFRAHIKIIFKCISSQRGRNLSSATTILNQ